MLEQRIQQQFFESADLKYHSADLLARPIAEAAGRAIVGCLTSGGKVLACGNGGSAADAQHVAARSWPVRAGAPRLPAMALTTDAAILTAVGNDYGSTDLLQAGRRPWAARRRAARDSTSGNSANVIAAVQAAHEKEMTVIALTGQGGGKMREQLTETDVQICVPHDRTARIQEVHLLAVHCLCDAIDRNCSENSEHK